MLTGHEMQQRTKDKTRYLTNQRIQKEKAKEAKQANKLPTKKKK